MSPITAELLADEQAFRLVVIARESATTEIEHRTEFALEVCPSPTCHCRDMTLVRDASTAPHPQPPTEFFLDPFARTVVAATTALATGQPSGQAIAEAIPTEDWQRLRHAFFAAKARAFAAIDCSHELAEFPFEDVERSGVLVPLRHALPFVPHFTLPATGNRLFTVDEQYCVRPGCDCTETVLGLSSYCTESAGPRIDSEPVVDFLVDWQHNQWRIAAESRQLTPAEEDLRSQLLAANPDLLTELRHRHEIMNKLYEVSAAAAGRPEGGREPIRAPRRIGRNEPCPCGSGKKYKKCCLPGGAAAAG